jgi:hypothetical protein
MLYEMGLVGETDEVVICEAGRDRKLGVGCLAFKSLLNLNLNPNLHLNLLV